MRNRNAYARQPKIRSVLWWLALSALAVSGSVAVLVATTRGAGVSPDSTVYLSMARAMLNALGYQFVLQGGGDFPPLFPFLLAAGGIVTGDPASAARYLNAFFLSANIALVGITLRTILPRAFWIPLLGAWFMLTALVVLLIHAMAWSEPAFLFFGMGGMLALARYLQTDKLWQLLGAAVAMGLAALDRYIGLTFGAAGLAALCLLQRGELRRRLVTLTLFTAFAFLPLALRLFQQPTRRLLTFQLPAWEYFEMPLTVLAAWLVPAGVPLLTQIRPWLVVFLVLALGCGIALAVRARRRHMPLREIMTRVPNLFWVWCLFLVCYLAGNLGARIFMGPSLLLHERAMAPVLVALLVLGLSSIGFVHATFAKAYPALRYALIVLALLAVALNLRAAAGWLWRTRSEGLYYASKTWQESPILARVRELPDNVLIYSNGSDAIYFITGRAAVRVPNKADKMNRIANQAYLEQMKHIGAQLAAGRAVLVDIDRYPDRWQYPNENELRAVLPLRVIAREADGVILQ